VAPNAGVTAGRPRDPGVDDKVARAAIDLFGAEGWAGFSIESVARRAGVGKASIYLRWPTKEALLLEALRRHVGGVADVEAGNVRDELVRLARRLLDQYVGDAGQVMLRISLEAERIPGVAEHWAAIRESRILAARTIVRRAIARGELPRGTSVTLLLDTLCGAVINHVLATPPDARQDLATDPDAYARALVDFLLTNTAAATAE